jgi:hypothetical protein
MMSIKSYRKKHSLILLVLISSMAGIAFMTTLSSCYVSGVTNKASITADNNTTITVSATTANTLITSILAKSLENHLQKVGAILEITSKLPQIRNVSYAHLINQTLKTLHGVPQYADMQMRQVAKNILATNSGLYKIFFIMPDGDMYLLEPYSIQLTLTANNYAFRDYFQGAIKTNELYVGNVIISKAVSGDREAVIAARISFLLNVFKIEPHRLCNKRSHCRFHIYSQMFEIIKKFGRDDHRSFTFLYCFICFHIRY